jgi:hypothetical protein
MHTDYWISCFENSDALSGDGKNLVLWNTSCPRIGSHGLHPSVNAAGIIVYRRWRHGAPSRSGTPTCPSQIFTCASFNIVTAQATAYVSEKPTKTSNIGSLFPNTGSRSCHFLKICVAHPLMFAVGNVELLVQRGRKPVSISLTDQYAPCHHCHASASLTHGPVELSRDGLNVTCAELLCPFSFPACVNASIGRAGVQ